MTATPITISATTSRLVRFVGILGIIAGVIMIVAGGTVWVTVSSQLAAEKITVAEDAAFLAGAVVADPFTAYAEADIISASVGEDADTSPAKLARRMTIAQDRL